MSAGFNELGNITAADLVVIAACEQIADGGAEMVGFAENDAVTADMAENGVVRMGVDGFFVAGFKYIPRSVSFMILPTSPFYRDLLINCMKREEEIPRKLRWDIDITYPAIGMTYHCENGVLTSVKEVPDAKEVLENIQAQFKFQFVKPSRT